VAAALRERGVDAMALAEWHGGQYLGADDAALVRAAAREGRALVTYDLRTMVPLLQAMAESGEAHAGVVLVSARSIPPHRIGDLVGALWRLATETEAEALRGQVIFLTRAGAP